MRWQQHPGNIVWLPQPFRTLFLGVNGSSFQLTSLLQYCRLRVVFKSLTVETLWVVPIRLPTCVAGPRGPQVVDG